MIQKLLISEDNYFYYVPDVSMDFHCKDGLVKAKDLKKKDGSVIKSNIGISFTLVSPSFIDRFLRIKRGPQVLILKDLGYIVAETGINKESRIVDAGSGSGAMACFLANTAKEVTTYELRNDFFKITEQNIKFLSLKNITLKKGDIYRKIDEKNIDVVALDVPEPWKAIDASYKALKFGGFIVSYSPTIPQVIRFVNAVKKNKKLLYLRTVELSKREWKIEGRAVRPRSGGIGHTGYLTFARKVR